MDLEEFVVDLSAAVATRAAADNEFTSVAFMSEVAERLADVEEIESLHVLSFEGVGSKRRRLAVHGFDLDDADNSIALAVLAFGEDEILPRLAQADARRVLASLEAFLVDALSGEFEVGREEAAAEYQLAADLRSRGRNVSRYKLYLVTNYVMSDRVKEFESSELNGVPVDYHIWDVGRLHQVSESARGREELVIDLSEWLPIGMPALEVPGSDDAFVTYLAAVPADVLAELYGRYGSRLLEGNVRSYLSNRGKVNKGIRATIQREPDRFLAYNNGITATATQVTLGDNGNLVKITDLQIVNGGQTTASLFYVNRDESPRPDLSTVYAQMKLVVVSADVSAELVPQISRYANSQNRVSEADFFSNSPFHVRMEELSRRLLVPAQAGVNYQTKWFYERTRGQYQNEKAKLRATQARQFDLQYPKSQLISKTDAARYEVSWQLKPHMVSRGAQLNFVAFATSVAAEWNRSDLKFNEIYFRGLVAKGILFNRARFLISHAEWYESGYLANIVTYTVAKLVAEVAKQGRGGSLDLQSIWNTQAISEAIESECLRIGELVLGQLTSPQRVVVNVTEWAKREECWTRVAAAPFILSDGLIRGLESPQKRVDRASTAAAAQKIDGGIASQQQVLNLGQEYWIVLKDFATRTRIISPTDDSILRIVTSQRGGVPTERQAARLLKLKETAEGRGFAPDEL